MITLIYAVQEAQADNEKLWLKAMQVYPSWKKVYDWNTQKAMVRFGVIVSPEVATSIRLRHGNVFQQHYTQR